MAYKIQFGNGITKHSETGATLREGSPPEPTKEDVDTDVGAGSDKTKESTTEKTADTSDTSDTATKKAETPAKKAETPAK